MNLWMNPPLWISRQATLNTWYSMWPAEQPPTRNEQAGVQPRITGLIVFQPKLVSCEGWRPSSAIDYSGSSGWRLLVTLATVLFMAAATVEPMRFNGADV